MDYIISEEWLAAEEYINFLKQTDLAASFYKKIGMTRPHDMMVYDHAEWTSFTVE